MRITKKMKEEYKKIQAATKRKVKNTVKNHGAIIHDIVNGEVVAYDIRSKLNIPSIESFKNKKEFDEFMYEQRKFTSGRSPRAKFFKNKEGMVMTDYLKMVLQNRHHTAEKNRLKEVKRLKDRGLLGAMEQEAVMLKRPTNPALRPNTLDFDKFYRKMQIENKLAGLSANADPDRFDKKKETWKQNFIAKLQFAANSNVDGLVEAINEMDTNEFYELMEELRLIKNKNIDIQLIPSPQTEIMYGVAVDKAAMDEAIADITDAVSQYWEGKLTEMEWGKLF